MFTKDDFNKLNSPNPTTNDKRRNAIIDYLRNNPGCTKEDVIRGVRYFFLKKSSKYIKQTKRRRTNHNRKRIKSIPEKYT